VDIEHNCIVDQDIDLAQLARELSIMQVPAGGAAEASA